MPLPSLTQENAITQLRAFFRDKPFLFFGTGLSCALDVKFGMPALQKQLVCKIEKLSLTKEQNAEWASVKLALDENRGLEVALNSIQNSEFLKIIVQITATFVANLDRKYTFAIAKGAVEWPAMRLMLRLVEKLPSSDPILHVLTPNYDMLFEYACDIAGIEYTNGFFGGIARRLDWAATSRALSGFAKIPSGKRKKSVLKNKKYVRLYKVHGSLNYFSHRNVIIENDAWTYNSPDFVERVMITPGLSKYQTLQKYRQELLQSADAAIAGANRFLFLGYGFNDSHLEEYVKPKLIQQACNGLIITRDLNPRIEALLGESQNLWIVCKIEGDKQNGSRIYNKQYSDWLVLPRVNLWDIKEFTTQVLGG